MRKVETQIQIKISPSEVLKAFYDPEMLSDWWGVERHLIDLNPGGVYTLAWQITDNGFGYVSSGVVASYVPEEELIVRDMVYLNPERPILGPMSMKVKVSREGGGTFLHITQDGYQSGEHWDWYYEAVKEAWPQAARNLKSYLERTVT